MDNSSVAQSGSSPALPVKSDRLAPSGQTPLRHLEMVCDDIFDRWDVDMRSGKLLAALNGRIAQYDPRVTSIRAALAAYPSLLSALQRINAATMASTNSGTLAEYQSWIRAVAATAIADTTDRPTQIPGGEQ